MKRLLCAVAVSSVLAGCTNFPWDEPVLASAVIDAAGGRIEAEGIALEIPAGALFDATPITISYADVELGDDVAALGPAFHFEPEGLEFAQPITVHLDVPEGSNGFVLWSLRDGSGFEFAGFVEDGRAIATSMHFSTTVPIGEGEGTPSACSTNGCEDGCGNADEEASPDSSCAGVREPCMRLCVCDPIDMPGSMELCSDDPEDPRVECDENLEPTTEILANHSERRPMRGTELLAHRDGETCAGWGVRNVEATVCDCLGLQPWRSETPEWTPLCPVPWVDLGGSTWRCITDVTGMPPHVLRDGVVYDNLDFHAWNVETHSGGCSGHWLDQRGTFAVSRGTVPGQLDMASCDLRRVGEEWRLIDGVTAQCYPFSWPDGAGADAAADNGLTPEADGCGNLGGEQWQALQQSRSMMGLDPRSHRDRSTAAILRVDGQPTSSQIRGYNGRAYGNSNRPPGAQERQPNDFCGEGRSRSHAEGDALNQLARQRGSEPYWRRVNAQDVAAALLEGVELAEGCPPAPERGFHAESPMGECPEETGGGRAEMWVDRDPCGASCQPYGIDRMRRAACLDELIVHSPSRSSRFAADVASEAGQLLTP
jgi:hypothetical protein